ncbi:MAG: UDP-3-O-(3-hydroxymyristoyl)glucosamine N-acyltransferase [Thermoanaerobaculia bacterium]
MASFSVAEVAAACGGRVAGGGDATLTGVRSLESAGPDSLSFVSDARALKRAASSRAGALLARSASELPGRTVIEVADPAQALVAALRLFHPQRRALPGIHPTAALDPSAVVDPGAEIGPYAVIGASSRVDAGAIIEAHAVVGARCRVGKESRLHPHVVLYDDVALGERVEVHGGAVLGADGFGYVTTGRGLVKIPQVGSVAIGDDVEIGANTCIDRAALEATSVGSGTKIDNLVQIGHNVTVGRHDVLCAQVGIAGSAVLGDGVVLGGQVGVAGHLTVGEGAKIQAQSGIGADVPPGQALHGTPAFGYRDYQKSWIELRRLPQTARLVRRLAEKAGLLKEGDS